jgi:ATP/ADP translocase
MITFQVGGKATRDALFLRSFDVSVLPRMVVLAALLTVPVVLWTARSLGRRGPHWLVPRLFAASGLILLALWAIWTAFPRLSAVLLYLHMGCFGAVLVSSFWSALNERFDPRTAKKQMGRIGTGSTTGGLIGGLLAAGVGRSFGDAAMLPLLAALHFGCAVLLRRALRTAPKDLPAPEASEAPPGMRDGFEVLGRVRYLRDLASLVVVGTFAAACLDFVFKARAQSAFGNGQGAVDLITFFGVFYTALSLLTLLLQSGLSRLALERLGLARTVATLPLGMLGSTLLALIAPGLGTVTAARATEGGLRNSLFRSGYEPLYTPLGARERRASKTIIDVGSDRLGDVLGGLSVQLVLLILPAPVFLMLQQRILLGISVLLGLLSLVICVRIGRGYVKALEKSLLRRVVVLDHDEVVDATTRTMVLRTLGSAPVTGSAVITGSDRRGERMRTGEDLGESPPRPQVLGVSGEIDALLRTATELRSRDPQRVLRTLATSRPLRAELVPFVVPLLAWDAVSDSAIVALRSATPRSAGALIDAVLDPDVDFSVRRRAPRALEANERPDVIAGLVESLFANRFEIRYQCGQALSRCRQAFPDLRFPRPRIFDAVQREAQVDRRVWESQRLLDSAADALPLLGEVVHARINRSLEHVFTLLSLVLPREPLRVAYKGLLTEDQQLRGTALEYLESVLPSRLREVLWPALDAPRIRTKKSQELDRETVLDQLLRSHESIDLNLDELRRRSAAEPPSLKPDPTDDHSR